ncbi:DUF3575 domain-containing protein [Lutibacter sp. HS1-25]|uniref:DUF3575 domain-containing protein n=1 Tax=Lutibacter sp. HS1-25 TaxID=2485000 RepID=UPI0010112B45|nr:DUF3575 domain-containing protein [Lutibacter sp. HS1-25]RXP64635.1 DUF3575 domain-containing protein [Lutibacter sp. HS1-25]
MKKLFCVASFLLIGFYTFAQESTTLETTSTQTKTVKNNSEGNNEIKLNVAYLLGGIPEIGYAYLINDESSVGLDVLFAIDDELDIKFALTPYYRVYFGNKKATGFFVEGFGMLNVVNNEYYYDPFYYDYNNDINYPNSSYDPKNETDFALGVSVGGKFMTNSGFVFEVYGGAGRNLFSNNSDDFVPRFGLTFGKRF